jgi:hypothetical protein
MVIARASRNVVMVVNIAKSLKMAAKSASGTLSGAASAAFGLAISEKWIRERLNLQKDSLGV